MEIDALQIVFQPINFGVVFLALSYFLYRPIIKIIDERRAKTDEARKATEEVMREKEQIEALKKKTKIQAEKDAEAILDAVRTDAKDLKAKLASEVKAEISALRAKEQAKIESEQQAMEDRRTQEAGKLALSIANRVIGAEVDEKRHRALIQESIKTLGKLA